MLLLSAAAVVTGSWFKTTSTTPAFSIVSGSFSTSKICVMVGNNGQKGVVVRSKDSGFTWTSKIVNYPMTDVAVGIFGSTYFLAVSRSGTIALSMDNGANFTETTTLTTTFLNGVAIGSNKNAYAVGATMSNTVAKIYRSNSATPAYSLWADVTPTSPVMSKVSTVICDIIF